MRVGRFLAELRRRKVFRVAAGYLVAAWIMIEAADVIFPALDVPDRWLTVLVWAAFAGFPVTVVLAWIFDITPEGIMRTPDRLMGVDPAAGDVDGQKTGGPTRPSDGPPARPSATRSVVSPIPRSIGVAGAGVALVLLLGMLYVIRQRTAPEPVRAGEVAVLPFSVQAGPELAYLGEGMVNLLSTKLDGAGDLRSVDPHAVIGVLRQEDVEARDPESARRIAARLGAGSYVLGDVNAAGARGVHLQAYLYDADGRLVTRASAEGEADDLLDLVDDLAAQLLVGWSGSPGGRVTRVAAVTTHSLPALKSYLQGEQQFRRGNFSAALQAFRQAVAHDTAFALAHYRLSIAGEWAGGADETTEAAEAAVAHSDRLSEHDRLLVEAMLAWRYGRGGDAERRYRTIVGAYPEDVEAWFQLAEVLFHFAPLRGGSPTEARSALERVLFYDSDHLPATWHLARVAALEDRTAELDSLVARLRVLSPDGDRVLELEALRAFHAGAAGAQQRVVDALGRASDLARFLSVWDVALFAGELDGARRLAGTLTDDARSGPVRATGHTLRAFLDLALGRPGSAAEEIEHVRALDPDVAAAYHALALLLPQMPTSTEALRDAREALHGMSPDSTATALISNTMLDARTRMQPHIRAYLLGILDARLDGGAAARRRAAELIGLPGNAETRELADDLAWVVRAEAALADGDTTAALAALDSVRPQVLYTRTIQAPFYSLAHARWLRGEILTATGRDRDALRWFGSFDGYSVYDLAYEAPARMRQAEIHERLGESGAAREAYARFIERWSEAEPSLGHAVEHARTRMEALAAEDESYGGG